MDILLIYQFCTFGGVERMLLNRAQVLQEARASIKLSVSYLWGSHAFASFQNYIRKKGLDNYLSASIFPTDGDIDWDKYQSIFIIDTPQIFHLVDERDTPPIFIECHTPYVENRLYLERLPKNIRGIIVPSISLQTQIQQEFQNLPPIFVLPNPVPEEFYEENLPHVDKVFLKRPLAYLARLDTLKNFSEAAKIFSRLKTQDELMYFVIGHNAIDTTTLHLINTMGLTDKTVVRNSIPFEKVPYLTALVREHRGAFISPSKGETFGLSAAEFMAAGVPVLLSDIPAHRELVENDQRFLYPLGNIKIATQRLRKLLNEWESMSPMMKLYSEKFRAKSFYEAWNQFLSRSRMR